MARAPRSFVRALHLLLLSMLFSACMKSQPRYVDYSDRDRPAPESQSSWDTRPKAKKTAADAADRAPADDARPDSGDEGVVSDEATARPVADPTASYSLSASKMAWDLANQLLPYINTPYKYGGESVKGIDCSGLTRMVYGKAFEVDLPHKAAWQYKMGRKVRKSRLMPGDLVFFWHTKKREINHVGIYLSENQFIHSMIRKGVVISDLDGKYWKKNWAGARRFIFSE